MNLMLFPFLILTLLSSLKTQEIILEDPLPSCKGFTISYSGSPVKFGYSIDGNGGDINGDKVPDIIISDYQYPNPSILYVIYGTKNGYSDIDVATMTQDQGFKITGALLFAGDNTNQLSISGDIDGDGISDIVIGAGATNGDLGVIYVIYGKKGGYLDFDVSSLTSDKGYRIIGSEGRVGWSLNTKIDLNGDRINDILIGANTAGPNLNEGAAFIVYGQKTRGSDLDLATMPPNRGFRISGYIGSYTGAAVGSAGDFNQDDVDDIIVASPGASSFVGNSYVVYGRKDGSFSDFSLSTMVPSQGFTLTGQTPYSKLALVASDAGDFNNDGISDIILSAWDASAVGGYTLIFYGKKGGPPDLSSSSITASEGLKIEGATLGDQFGSSLSSTQDLNGDGITDLLIGANGYSTGLGALYILFGREDQPSTIDLSTLTSNEGVRILGSIASGALGSSVRSLGDINQDRVPDMIVGAPGAQRAYVLFGPNAWGCETCETSSTCKTCQSGYNYTYNGLCYQKCPINAPYSVGSECLTKSPPVIPVTLKEGLTKSADAITAANKVMNLWSPLSALPFIYGQLKTSIIFMRYLNISRIQKLEELYQIYTDTDSPAVPFITMKSSMKDAFPFEPLPFMFEKYELPSSFIENFGDDLMGLLVVFGILIIAEIACFLMKRWENKNLSMIKMILQRVSLTLQNFLIGSFGESLGPIILYTTLEFRHLSKGKDYYLLSPIICCFSLVLGLSVIFLCIWTLRKFHKIRKTSDSQKERFKLLEKKYEGIAVLFDEFDNSSLTKQSGFLIFTLKAMAESLIMGLLFQHPLAQAVLLLLLIFTLLAYTIIKRPFESKISGVQQSVLVFFLFTCNVCLTIMAGIDVTEKNFNNVLQSTSQIIFWVLVLFQFIPLVFFAIGLGQEVWKLYKWFFTIRSKKIKKPSSSSKIAQVHPSSSITYQSVLSINNSRTNLPEAIMSSQVERDQPLVLSFEAENNSPSQKSNLLTPTRRTDQARQRISLRERMSRTEVSLKSKELADEIK